MTEEQLTEHDAMDLESRRKNAQMLHLPSLHVSIETWPYTKNDHAGKVYSVEFVVYPSYHWTKGNETGVSYQRYDSPRSPDPVDSLEEADWHIMGGIKWDGCINYKYNQVGCLLHKCGVYGFEEELEIWKNVYRACHSWMPDTVDWKAP